MTTPRTALLAPLHATLLALLAIAAGACEGTQQPGGECAVSADCQGGALCDVRNRRCLPALARKIDLEVVPPGRNNQGWAQQEFVDRKAGANGELLLTMADSISVQAQVFRSDAPQTTLPAQGSIWRDSLLAGRPTVRSDAITTTVGGKDRLTFWVPPGYDYSVFARPLDETYPPAFEHVSTPTDDVAADLTVAGPDHRIEIRGRIADSGGTPLPFSVQVRAFVPGKVKSGALHWSTVGYTCSERGSRYCKDQKFSADEAGAFSIYVPALDNDYTLRIEPIAGTVDAQPNQTLPLIPTLDCVGMTLGVLQPGTKFHDINRIKLPSYPPIRLYSLRVVGQAGVAGTDGGAATASTDGGSAGGGVDGGLAGAPAVADAVVTFTSQIKAPQLDVGIDGCSARYVRTARTDSNGSLRIPLLPSEGAVRPYDVAIVAPPGSGAASQMIRGLNLSTGTTVLDPVALEPRLSYAGRVLDADGAPVKNATLEAQQVDTGVAAAAPSKLPLSRASTTTDADGAFALDVDPGVYNLHITPPESAGLAPVGLPGTPIDASTTDVAIQLPAAHAVLGRVLNALDQAPAFGFTVNVYKAFAVGPDSTRAVLQASAVTDAQGRFLLLLPQ